MTFLAVFLGVIVALVLIALVLYLVVKVKIKNIIGINSYNLIKNKIKNGEFETDEEAYSKSKSISGMTSIYEPHIRRDFHDFNLSLLFSNVENNLRSILNAKTSKNIALIDNEQLEFVRNVVKKEIDDMKLNNIDVSYKDITFNKHVIKKYKKKDGTATITTASSLSYYYSSNKKEEKYENIKKGVIYVCEFIYVYDEAKFENSKKVLSINCPNCGAPVAGLDGGTCFYCGTYSKPINLKAWKMVSYKEEIN